MKKTKKMKIGLQSILFLFVFLFGILEGDNMVFAAPTKVIHFGFESNESPQQPADGNWNLGCSGNCPVITSEQSRTGSKSIKTFVDRLNSPTMYRTEFSHRMGSVGHMEVNQGTATQDYWTGFSVYIPDSYIPMTNSVYEIFYQLHASPPDGNWSGYNGLNPNLGFRLYPSSSKGGYFGINTRGNDDPYPQTKSISTSNKQDIPYQTNRWHDFVIHTRLDSVNGFTKVWMDGRQIVNFNGSNYYRGHGYVYPKFGMYNGWRTRDISSEVVQTRTLYHDEYRFAYGPDANYYSVVAPGGGTPPTTPPISSFTSSPSSITQGQSMTLSWSSTNTTSCTGTNFSTNNETSGSLSLSPSTTTTYTLRCTGPGGEITKNVNVTVAQSSTTRSSYATKPSLPSDSIFSFHFDTLTQQSQEVSGQNITYFETDPTNTQSIRNPSLPTPFPQIYPITGVSELPPLFKVGSNKQNEWKEYTVDIPQTITVTPKLRVSSKDGVSSNPTFKGTLGDIDFLFTVPTTSDWNNWTTVEALPITLEQGNNQIIRVTNLSQGADWHRLWFEEIPPTQDLLSLSLKTPPSPVVNNPQSLLEIQTNQSGTLSFTGDCTFTPTAVQAGSIFLTLTNQQKKTYSNCKITLTNEQNQQSNPLTIPSFTLSYRSDLNKDTKVDIFDFTLLVSNFGKNECNNLADLNNDCKVDIFDFTIFLQEFGRRV